MDQASVPANTEELIQETVRRLHEVNQLCAINTQQWEATARRLQALEGDEGRLSSRDALGFSLSQTAKVPTFRGDRHDNMDTIDWLQRIKNYMEMAQIPSRKWVNFAAVHLEGPALTWWFSRRKDEELPTWPVFEEEFVRAFVKGSTEVEIRLELLDLKYTDLRSYTAQFRKLTMLLPKASEADKIALYMWHLPLRLQRELRYRMPNTFDHAEQIADALENASRHNGNRQQPPRNGIHDHRNRETDAMEIDSITRSIKPLSGPEKEALKKAGGCFRCRKPGHLARNCPLGKQRNLNNIMETYLDEDEGQTMREAGKDLPQ